MIINNDASGNTREDGVRVVQAILMMRRVLPEP